MYDAHEDPYAYLETGTLKNLANIKDAEKLKLFELAMLTTRIQESFPKGDLNTQALPPNPSSPLPRYLFMGRQLQNSSDC